jgi:putative membrane protein
MVLALLTRQRWQSDPEEDDMNKLASVAGGIWLAAAMMAAQAQEPPPAVDPAVEPSGDQRSRRNAPGEAIPGTSVRPEGIDQSNVPKTPLDRKKATAEDIGANNTDGNKPPLKEADRMFLMQAHQTDMTEMQAGEMAKTRAKNPEVKAYGEMMMKDHKKSHGAGMTLAKSNALSLPDKLDSEHQAMADKLKSASDATFDEVFMQQMVAGHQKAIALHEKTSKESKDAEVKALADGNLPVLKKHLMEAQRVQSALKASPAK